MSLKTLQNFYKQTVSQIWETGTGIKYVSVKPTPSEGWVVVSPSNTSLREIVYYTSTGTDSTGDYIVVSQRGLGGTSDQVHNIGEPVRMNYTAQHQQEISDALDQIVAAGAQDASTSTKGIVKLSTAPASASNPIAVGTNDTRLPTSEPSTYLALKSDIQVFTADGTWTKPTGAKVVEVVCVGAGGSGGGGQGAAAGNIRGGGTGGGGGSKVQKIFQASTLSATVAVTVAISQAGGAGGVNNNGSQGTDGGSSSFGTYSVAYGGGAGGDGRNRGAGSGGGTGGAGISASASAILGGLPASVAGANGISGQGAGSAAPATSTPLASLAEFGGASGGAISTNAGGSGSSAGGSSIFGGAGGAGGGSLDAANTVRVASGGGVSGAYTISGSGGTAGTAGSAGGAGTSRSGYGCGDGGGGGAASSSTTGGAGGAGGAPGGGGGGGGGGTSTGGAGGVGGRGEVIVITYF